MQIQRFDLSRDELEHYRPHVREPEDFDAFWAHTLAEHPFEASAVTRQRVETPLRTLDVWDVSFPGFAADPIHAWLILPAHARTPLPTVVQYIGYGGGRGLPNDHLEWASAGFAHLVMDTRGQGSGWEAGVTPDLHGSAPAYSGMMTRGIGDPRSYYYRRVYVDAHHAVEAAATFPEVDASRIAVHGVSQGGGLCIAAAALNGRVAAALPDVPFLCHFERAVGMTGEEPYSEIVRYLAVQRGHEKQVFRTLSYVDGVNMAKRASVPALFSTALMDTTCPPSTVFAARNWWGSLAQSGEGEGTRREGMALPGEAVGARDEAVSEQVGADERVPGEMGRERDGASPCSAVDEGERRGGTQRLPEIVVYPFNGHEGGQSDQWVRQAEWLRTQLA